jgi:hypothetical protein
MSNKYIFAADTTITNKVPALVTLLDYIANNNLTDVEYMLIQSNLQNVNNIALQLKNKSK